VNLEDTVHAHQFEQGLYRAVEAAQAQLTLALAAGTQARNQGANTGTVDELDIAKIDNDTVVVFDHSPHCGAKRGSVAGIDAVGSGFGDDAMFVDPGFDRHDVLLENGQMLWSGCI